VTGVADVDVYIDDWSTSSSNYRTWYDGVGYARVTTRIPGDFDGDGDVDGNDFLAWQRNPALGDLADWEANYGAPSSLSAGNSAVPEPISGLLLAIGMVAAVGLRSRNGHWGS